MPMSRAAAQALDDFRIGSGAEIEALLGRLEAERTLVTLSSPDGHSFTTLLWNLDVPRRQLAFHAEGGGDTIAALLTSSFCRPRAWKAASSTRIRPAADAIAMVPLPRALLVLQAWAGGQVCL